MLEVSGMHATWGGVGVGGAFLFEDASGVVYMYLVLAGMPGHRSQRRRFRSVFVCRP